MQVLYYSSERKTGRNTRARARDSEDRQTGGALLALQRLRVLRVSHHACISVGRSPVFHDATWTQRRTQKGYHLGIFFAFASRLPFNFRDPFLSGIVVQP